MKKPLQWEWTSAPSGAVRALSSHRVIKCRFFPAKKVTNETLGWRDCTPAFCNRSLAISLKMKVHHQPEQDYYISWNKEKRWSALEINFILMYCLNVLYRFKEEKRKLWEESVFRIIRPDLLSQEKQESTESVWVHYRLRGTNVSAAVRDVVQISTLALSFRSQALLAIGWIFISPLKEKKVKIVVGVFYFFFFFSTTTTTHRSFKPFSSGYFWTTTICLGKCPEEGGALPKKSNRDDGEAVFF